MKNQRDGDSDLLSEKMPSLRENIPSPPTCMTAVSEEMTMRTKGRALRQFGSKVKFRTALKEIDQEFWEPIEKDGGELAEIKENPKTEEFDIIVHRDDAQPAYDSIQKLRIAADVIQTAKLMITIPLPLGTKRVCLRVARFGEKYRRYDSETNTLVDPSQRGKAIRVLPEEREKVITVEVECSTRYAVKYCVTTGKKHKSSDAKEQWGQGDVVWSPYCNIYQVRTPSENKPPPPTLKVMPGGRLGINLPKLPPNAQHLTLWLKKQTKDGEDFKVYDYLTKKVVDYEGRAIPIWDFGRYVELKLEPDVEYSVKYSVMQDGKWREASFITSARTLPLQPWLPICPVEVNNQQHSCSGSIT